ncbi:MAG: hypothetical protein AAF821_02920 [Cyanobacteria bacterium P01_D01_bin.156]
MARHPILAKRFSQRLQALFGRSLRRLVRFQASKQTRRGQKVHLSRDEASIPSSESERESFVKAEGASSEGKAKSNRGRFWVNLFWVHPWLLVGGLWLTFLAMIVIAIIGLSSPGRELVLEPPISSRAEQPLSAPDAAAAARLSHTNGSKRFSRRDPAAIAPGNTAAKNMPTWPLLIMVLACAGGCMLMSHHGLSVNNTESRRNQRRGMLNASSKQRLGARKTIGTSGKQRRRHRRLAAQRPSSQVMAFRTGQKLQYTDPQPSTVASQSVSFAINDSEPAKSVTVISADESSPLDWPEGSLAHKLDVRQKRSINSFLR